MKAETLTSAKNPLLKKIRRAIDRGSATDDGYSIAEGLHLIEEAVRSDCEIHAVLAAESAETHVPSTAAPIYLLPDRLFREIVTTEASQGITALVRIPSWSIAQLLRPGAVTIVLDGVQEPGNAGAIVRAAEAFEARGVIFLKGTVNPHNPKCLRAAAGSLFRLPFVDNVDDRLLRDTLVTSTTPLFAAMPDGDMPVHQASLKSGCILLIGNEGRGVRPEWTRDATGLRIPTHGVESLNAAVAAAIVLYEAQRQRIAG